MSSDRTPRRDANDKLLGTTIAGRYQVLELVGSGGMGTVYRALHTRVGDEVALKLLRAGLAEDDEQRQRFLEEPQKAARIRHPNIVRVRDAGETDDGRPYLACDFIEGENLHELVERQGALTPAKAISLVGQVANALDAAHTRGLVHRDVKPTNILVDRSGQAYLTDFGIAKDAALDGHTRKEAFLGTIQWAAPEQIRRKQVSSRTDVYALGCVLFHALTASQPFAQDSEFELMEAHVRGERPKASEVNTSLPAAIDTVIEKALSLEPEERYPSAAALTAAAASALGLAAPAGASTGDGEGQTVLEDGGTVLDAGTVLDNRPSPVPAPPPGGAAKTPFLRRERMPILIAAAAALVILLGIAAFAFAGGGDDSGGLGAPLDPSGGPAEDPVPNDPPPEEEPAPTDPAPEEPAPTDPAPDEPAPEDPGGEGGFQPSTDLEADLWEYIPEGITDCEGRAADDSLFGSRALVTISCALGNVNMHYGLFADKDSLYREYDRHLDSYGVTRDQGAEPCPDVIPNEGTWSSDGTVKGRLLCFADDDANMIWTADATNVLTWAWESETTSFDNVESFWRENTCLGC
jgi:hypothetical protein